MENQVYMVKAVADALTAAALDGTLDTLLHRNEGSLSVTDHTTLWIARENEAHVVGRRRTATESSTLARTTDFGWM